MNLNNPVLVIVFTAVLDSPTGITVPWVVPKKENVCGS